MRRWVSYVAVAAVGAAVVVGGTAGAGDGRPTDRSTEQFSLWAVPDPESEAFLPADPNAATPTEGEEGPPAVGDEFVFTDILYAVGGTSDAPGPAGDPIGVNNGRCMASQVLLEEEAVVATCSGVVHLDGRGDLTWQLRSRFSESEDPGFIQVAITGGTGDFYDAGGEVVVREAGDDSATDDDEPPSIYEVQVLHLAQAAHSS